MRSKKKVFLGDTLLLDSLSVVPGSLRINGAIPDTALYSFDPLRSLLIRKDSTLTDTLQLGYAVFPVSFFKSYFLKDSALMNQTLVKPLRVYSASDAAAAGSFFADDIAKSGSLSRAIQVGNNQDLSVTSAFNMRLNGRLNERYQVIASISDANIPVQPSGNTRQLQDFDQIYIRVYDELSAIQAGDFQLKSTAHRYSNYFKRAQGIWYETRNAPPDSAGMRYSVAGALSKGKFSRNNIQGREGVQGPYRLTGSNGEQFVIIMAGTERIYIDGTLMERGEQSDYVIDYNTAELTFTPNRPITKDRRIVAEFQYSDKNYARSLYIAQAEQTGKRVDFYVDAYSEQDLRNQPLQADINSNSRGILANAGNDPLLAVISGADSTGFSPDFVQYALRDSLGYDSVFVFSTNPAEAVHRVSFSQVGAGKGFYVQDQFTPLGRTFRWVAPDTINGALVLNGDHMPLVLLPRPLRRQMVSSGVKIKAMENLSFMADGSLTNVDQNTFSRFDDQDNLNFAARAGVLHKAKTSSGYAFITALAHEFVDRHFNPVERFRPVEFERDWNLRNRNISGRQQLSEFSFLAQKGDNQKILASAERLLFGNDFAAWRTAGGLFLQDKKQLLRSDASFMQTSGGFQSAFVRSKTEAWRNFSAIRLGYQDEFENNRILATPDSLTAESYRFHDWEVYAALADSGSAQVRLSYRQRLERLPNGGLPAPGTFARQYAFATSSETKRYGWFAATFGFRQLGIYANENLPPTTTPERTLLSRFEHRFTGLSNALNINSFYETGSGLEPKREFIYLEVPSGQGNFVWVDHNGNGIKELNEFEQSPYQYEANYIRTNVPSSDYVRTYPLRFTESVNLDLQRLIPDGNIVARLARKFAFAANYQLERNLNTNDRDLRFNPFATPENELLNSQTVLSRATVFFQRANAKFNANATYRDGQTTQLLVNGTETRNNYVTEATLRWNFFKKIVLQSLVSTTLQTADSDFLLGRNFRIQQRSAAPEIVWMPEPGRQAGIKYTHTQKANTRGTETTQSHTLGASAVSTLNSKFSLSANVDLVLIQYNGPETGSSLRYELLDGLQPGSNYLWGITLQKIISESFQINLNYNGRAAADSPVIHIGNFEARFFF